METSISAYNLTDNSVYTAKIIVISSQGNVSTNKKLICKYLNKSLSIANSNIIEYDTDTTDIQKVQAVQVGNSESILVQCEFIAGTDAQGCSVVLVHSKNESINIIPNSV